MKSLECYNFPQVDCLNKLIKIQIRLIMRTVKGREGEKKCKKTDRVVTESQAQK